MKHVISLVFLFCGIASFGQNQIPVSFDERVDLVAAVFHLAGTKEYNGIRVPEYAKSLDEALADFKSHPAVELAQKLGEQNGVRYDAVVSYAMHLTFDSDSTLVFDNSFLEGSDTSFDRWSEQSKKDFLVELNDFYKVSGFHSWYESSQEIRQTVLDSFEPIAKLVDLTWFDNFFEKRENARFGIILSIIVGSHNYGWHAKSIDGADIQNPIIGGCRPDGDGKAGYNANDVFPVLIHEFSHSYCNTLDAKYWPLMEKKSAQIFKKVQKELPVQYGTPKTMIDETLVRSSVICYMTDHSPDADLEDMIIEENLEGFVLTRTFVNSLKERQKQADKYPTMDDYMPILVSDMNAFSMAEYKKAQTELAKTLVQYTVNIKNGTKDLPAGKLDFTITFDRPMVKSANLRDGSKGVGSPKVSDYFWSEDMKTLTMIFKLEPSTTYSVQVPGLSYRGQDGIRGCENRNYVFKTK